MTSPPDVPERSPALVAGEVRGYRRFQLAESGLCPPVHLGAGPWSGRIEQARCAVDEEHAPPEWGCGCGLYGWYHPSYTGIGSGWGNVTAVIAARGRVILGDSGFRAAAARVVAVALPRRIGLGRRGRWERMLAERYPEACVYRSRRRMIRGHPPEDLSGLGIVVHRNPAVRYGWSAAALWVCGVVALWTVAIVAGGRTNRMGPAGWLAALVCFLVWQAAFIWLVCRTSPPLGSLPRREPPAAR